ncbi:16S rRNA (uracil(1498)-N(3))-methyltransferase [Ectothiorhodospiraceae bacterium BW-2]|nr:16S rRNA (uracil(1498)-N(3))-methyltransferase [Ectothiorhodospiraceae bacterium BW-2]
MRHHRLYQPHLSAACQLALSADNSHYLCHVVKARVGESIRLFDGHSEGEYHATIVQMDRRHCLVEVGAWQPVERESPLHITLLQGVSKGDRMEWVVQKATELGVSRIVPILSDYSVVKLNLERQQKKQQQWQAIATAATAQSGRCRIATIEPLQSLQAWLQTHPPEPQQLRWLLHPTPLEAPLQPPPPLHPATALLYIGPEGGISDSEIELARQQQFIPITLGRRILRTETATIVALSRLQLAFGDLGGG